MKQNRSHWLVLLFLSGALIVSGIESSFSDSLLSVKAESNGENLMSNGDFEENSFTGWDVDNAPEAHLESDLAHHGQALCFKGNSPQYIQHNSVPLPSNTIYLFEYWINVTEANNLYFSTFWTGGNVGWVDFSSAVTMTTTNGWTRVKTLLTVPESSNPTESIYFGFKFYPNQQNGKPGSGTVYLDDVSIRAIQSNAGVGANLSFDYQVEGMPLNWTYAGSGSFLAQDTVLPEHPDGKYAAKIINPGNDSLSYITSVPLSVEPNTSYEFSYDGRLDGDYDADFYSMFIQYEDKDCTKVAYSPSFNAENSKNYYRTANTPSDPGTEFINPTWTYHLYGNSSWRRVAWSFVTGPSTHYLKARFVVPSGDCAAYIDNAKLTPSKLVANPEVGKPLWTQVEPNEDFELIDSNRKPVNWTMSNSRSENVVLTSDDTFFHSGRRSLYLETDTVLEKTMLDSAGRFAVTPGDIYEFSGYFSSSNCDPTTKISLGLKYFDADGNNIYNEYGDKLYLYGETYLGSCSSGRSPWVKMMTRSAIPTIARYVSYYVELTSGHAEIWFDDFRCKHVEQSDLDAPKTVYETTFSSVSSDGVIDDWVLNDDSRAMWIKGQEGAELLVAQGSDSLVSHRLECFITNYFYELRLAYNTSENGFIRIDFFNTERERLDGYSLESRLTKDSNPIDVSFSAPSATYAIVSIGLDGTGTLHLNSLLITQNAQPASKGSWSGKWVWLNENASNNPEQYRYFRYTFTLEDVTTYAPLQLTVDDKYVFYVNGQFVDFNWNAGSDSWANVAKYFLQDYLRPGKNVFAFKCYNLVSDAGLLFDGKFRLANGKEFVCASSREVKVSMSAPDDVAPGSKVVPDWAMVDYDDSSWEACKEYGMPPISPWGPVYYDASLYVDNKVKILSSKAPRVIEAGTDMDFSITFQIDEAISSAFDFSVGLVPSATSAEEKSVQKANLIVTSDNADQTKWPVGEPIVVSFRMPISSLVNQGRYDLRLESSVVSLTNDDLSDNRFLTFKVLESTKETEDLVSEVKTINGSPTLTINGKPYSPILYLRPDLNVYRQTDAEDRISNSTYELYMTYQGCLGKNGQDILYQRDGSLDYDAFDDAIISMVNASGNGFVLVNFGMFAPNWWKAEHLDDLVYSQNQNGKLIPDPARGASYVANATDVSFSSLAWRETSNELLGKLIDHMKTQKYYNRIFGLRITAGQTYEFMNVGTGADYLPDYSPVALTRFKEWAKEKYQTIDRLQAAWKDKDITFDTIAFPTLAERMSGKNTKTVYDITNDAWKIDYNKFVGEESGNALLVWAKTAKEKTNRTRIVGAYYGYLWAFGSYDGITKYHGAFEKVISSPDIDFIASPINYNERVLGMSSSYMSVLDSIRAYGKLYLQEQDNRTFNSDGYSGTSWDASWDYSVGEQHTIAGTIYNFRRDFAANFVQGSGYWHYDMYGGWLDDPQIYEFMANEKRIYDESLKMGEINYDNDVAVFIGDQSYSYLVADADRNSPYTLLSSLYSEQRQYLSRIGTGFDVYSLSSLKNGKVAPHKVNLFLSPYEVDAEASLKIKEYLNSTNHGVAIWLYLSGWSDGTADNDPAKNLSALTGFNISLETDRRSLETTFASSSNPLVKGLGGKRYGAHGGSGSISPRPVVHPDEMTSVLGTYSQGGEASLVSKDMGGYLSIYSGAPGLPTNFLRNVLEQNNVHEYSKNNNDIIYANSRYLAIHSGTEEEKTIFLPRHYAVYDEFKQEYVSLDCDSFTYYQEAGDTRLFRLDPVGGIAPTPVNPPTPTKNDEADMGQFFGISAVLLSAIGLLIGGKILFTHLWKRHCERRRIP